MPGEPNSPPYTQSARYASVVLSRRNRQEHMLADANEQHQQGMRAIQRGKRGVIRSATTTVMLVAVTAVCTWQSAIQQGLPTDAANSAWWWMLAATLAFGVAYLVAAGVHRGKQQQDAGRRLLLRAARQSRRAQEAP